MHDNAPFPRKVPSGSLPLSANPKPLLIEGSAADAKPARWLGKIALAVCVPLLALGLLEVAVRVYAHVTSQERLIVIDNVTGWRLAPNVHRRYDKETQPYFIVTNSKGLRDVEHAYDKPSGVYRIVVIGDSFVFGAGGVEPSKRFTDILQASLPNTEVINMGVPAYGTDQEYLYLADEGLQLSPRPGAGVRVLQRFQRKLLHH